MTDHRVLRRDRSLDQIADGDDAENRVVPVDDREVADMSVCHQLQTVTDPDIRRYADDGTAHDLPNSRAFRRSPFKNDLAGVIAFGNDPDQLSVVDDQHGTDIFFGHLSNSIQNSNG